MYPSTSAFSTCSRPRVSTRCSASPTRTSCTSSLEAEARGWTVVAAPRVERRLHGRGRLAHHRQARGLCIGTLGPGMAKHACAASDAREVENSPVIFLGGQRARITERRRPPRPHPVRPPGATFRGFGEVQRARSSTPTRPTRSFARRSARSMSGTPGPSYIEYPVARDPRGARRPGPAAAQPLPPGRTRALAATEVAEAAKLITRGQEPDPAGGPRRAHVAHAGEQVKELRRPDELPGDPDLGRYVVHSGARGPHLPLRVLRRLRSKRSRNPTSCVALGTELGEPVHYGRTGATGRAQRRSASGSTSSRIRPPSA